MQPAEITSLYYKLLYSGDLKGVKVLMTEASYMMTLESYGLRLSLEDSHFRELLKEIDDSEESLKKVEDLLSKDLRSRNQTPQIEILNSEVNGEERQTVNYTQDDKDKKLYFSKENDGWKINYYAGRRVN